MQSSEQTELSRFKENEVAPEFVYIHLLVNYGPLILTAPNPHISLPENVHLQPAPTTELSVKIENNGKYTHKKAAPYDLYQKIKWLLNKTSQDIISSFEDEFWKTIGDDFEKLEKFLSYYSEETISQVNAETKRYFENVKRLNVHNPQARTEITSVTFEGKEYPFTALDELKEIIQSRMAMFEYLSPLENGDSLYRAITTGEWAQIQHDGAYLVRTRTNFETTIGDQVEMFSNDPGYAGKVIRITVEGPWFKAGGFAVPRIESITAFYAKIEIKDGDNWIPFETYRAQNHESNS